eukprot:sb/3467132/
MSPAAVLSIPTILGRKRNGDELSDSEIQYFIDSVCDQSIHPSQIGAMLMTFCLRGLTTRETTTLTRAMMNSGKVQKWDPSWTIVDKHSTGGVGDKVTFPLVAALACFPVKIPMISGRGLGHTGGTMDKLEAIPGIGAVLCELTTVLRSCQANALTTEIRIGSGQCSDNSEERSEIGVAMWHLSGQCSDHSSRTLRNENRVRPYQLAEEKMWETLRTVGCYITTQTGDIAPADKTLYATRDITSTVCYAPLSCSSIMSKKLAEGLDSLVLDVKMIESFECVKGNGPEDLELIVAVQGIKTHARAVRPML